MKSSELQDWLLREGIKQDLEVLVPATAAIELQNVSLRSSLVDSITGLDWNRLMLAASLLVRSDQRRHKEAALRIATGALCLQEKEPIRDAAAIIFEQASNHRAVALAEERNIVREGLDSRLGLTARLESARRDIENAILFETNGERLLVNEFQKRFWDGVTGEAKWLSASAPTASGKTFLVLRWLIDTMTSTDARIAVYLAPTRALVSEIEENLKEILAASKILDIEVSSLPIREKHDEAVGGVHRTVYVFTQERLHLLTNILKENFVVDVLVVDEAHKIGDVQRGVVLQDAVERVQSLNPEVRTVFISPSTQNPGVLLEDAPAGTATAFVDSDAPTVVQNVIYARQVPRDTKTWSLSMLVDGEEHTIGNLALANRPTTVAKKMAFIAFSVGERGGTLVYANGAADAEDIGFLISQLVPDSATGVDHDLAALADLARKGVHKAYQLADLVERGVAFHYGNMPSLLRLEIERLFRAGKIKFLVCTSTLIEGVNLACKTIVVRGPRKGKGTPMTAPDFWNLAGRAGRWGNEFQGNIVCIDPDNSDAWPTGVPERQRYPIKRESDAVMDAADVLATFIERRANADAKTLNAGAQLESVSSYLLTRYLDLGDLAVAPFAKRHSPETINRLNAALAEASFGITVPAEIAQRHSAVSVVGLQKLLDSFGSFEGDISLLVPPQPEGDDAYDGFTEVMQRINATLFPAFFPETIIPLNALVVIEWMKGLSLARIIEQRLRYHRKHGREEPLSKVIRDTMKLVENVARFLAPKYFSAYVDVLAHHLDKIGRPDLLPQDLDIGFALEFGISTRTLLSLMQLGLSRMSASALYEIIAIDDLDQDGCRVWVDDRRTQLEGLDLPILVVREIREKILLSDLGLVP
jgi:hypothetical protein